MASLHPTEQAQVRSQSGPLASVPLTALPVHRVSRMDSEPFQVVLLRRLRMPGLEPQGDLQWRMRLLRSVGRVEHGSPRTFSSETWIWMSRTSPRMAEGLKLWRKGCLFSEVASWPWTSHWCQLCTGTGFTAGTQIKQTTSPCEKHARVSGQERSRADGGDRRRSWREVV